jgi:hypothetical protein
LIRELGQRGTKISSAQLERWRRFGLLPRNVRQGMGRGAGSRSEVPNGAVDYIEALAAASASGKSSNRTVLTLFVVGALQPEMAGKSSGLFMTYEAAVRRAFEWKIDRGNESLRRVRGAVAEPTDQRDPLLADSFEDGLDDAYKEAAAASDDALYRRLLRSAAREAAKLAGTRPASVDQLSHRREQALLNAALGPPAEAGTEFDPANWRNQSNETFPLDAAIFARGCQCPPRTTHMASTPEGMHEILQTATFSDLNTARAIGGTVTMLAPVIRRAALANPTDERLRAGVWLYRSTFFRGFLSEVAMLDLRRPETIVACTLAFLHNCAWLRSGAALLATLSRHWMHSTEIENALPALTLAVADALPRAQWIRAGLLGPLLHADGVAMALRLLQNQDPWMWKSGSEASSPSGCLAPYRPGPHM